jgi:hypothetical protein
MDAFTRNPSYVGSQFSEPHLQYSNHYSARHMDDDDDPQLFPGGGYYGRAQHDNRHMSQYDATSYQHMLHQRHYYPPSSYMPMDDDFTAMVATRSNSTGPDSLDRGSEPSDEAFEDR